MVKSTPVRVRLVLAAIFMMAMTVAARTAGGANQAQRSAAGQTAAKQAAFPAKFDWHDEEIGISTDPLKVQRDANPKWSRIEIKGRLISTKRDFSHVTITYGIYEGGDRIETLSPMVTGVEKSVEHDFRASKLGVLLRGGAVTWKIEEVSCLVAGAEAHYFGPERSFDSALAEIKANLDRYETYDEEFGILSAPGPFYEASGDKYLVDIAGKAFPLNFDCARATMKFGIYAGGAKIAEAVASADDLAKRTFRVFNARQSISASQVAGKLTYQVEEIICTDKQGKRIIHYKKS